MTARSSIHPKRAIAPAAIRTVSGAPRGRARRRDSSRVRALGSRPPDGAAPRRAVRVGLGLATRANGPSEPRKHRTGDESVHPGQRRGVHHSPVAKVAGVEERGRKQPRTPADDDRGGGEALRVHGLEPTERHGRPDTVSQPRRCASPRARGRLRRRPQRRRRAPVRAPRPPSVTPFRRRLRTRFGLRRPSPASPSRSGSRR